MNLLSLLLACSVHADDRLLQSIAYVHSRGNPFAVTNASLLAPISDQDEESTLTPSSPEAARALVYRILAAGGEPVLGLLPVRPDWAEEFGKNVGDLFEPCSNVAVASAKVSEFDHGCRSKGQQPTAPARRACTLARFGAGLGLPALRQVVMADLTLPSAFEIETPGVSTVLASLPSPTARSSGLFFALDAASHALAFRPLAPFVLPSDDEIVP